MRQKNWLRILLIQTEILKNFALKSKNSKGNITKNSPLNNKGNLKKENKPPKVQKSMNNKDNKNQIELSKEHAKLAGVDHLIRFDLKDAANVSSDLENGVIVTNPPYGKRVGEDVKEMKEQQAKGGKA